MGREELRQEIKLALKPIALPILDFLYPMRCAGCGSDALGSDKSWCCTCDRQFHRYDAPICSVCFQAHVRTTCSGCGNDTRPLLVAYSYRPPLREVILSLKFQSVTSVVDSLVASAHESFLESLKQLNADTLVPVPLAEGREYLRGYNQAELIAEAISRRAGIPVNNQLLYRISTRRPQSKVTRENRESNVSGLFALGKGVEHLVTGARIVVVDDIVTTGATCREVTRMLESSGVCVVGWMTLAHG